jgi:hypothetical protein
MASIILSISIPSGFLGAVLALAIPTAAAAACLQADTDGQVVEGRLTVQNAKDANSRTERPFILQLSSSACMQGPDADDNVKNTRTIHVAPLNERLQPAFHHLVGKTVVVSGNAFAAHTAHHHAPIVMLVTEIRPR